jgi:hypothetical protein
VLNVTANVGIDGNLTVGNGDGSGIITDSVKSNGFILFVDGLFINGTKV